MARAVVVSSPLADSFSCLSGLPLLSVEAETVYQKVLGDRLKRFSPAVVTPRRVLAKASADKGCQIPPLIRQQSQF